LVFLSTPVDACVKLVYVSRFIAGGMAKNRLLEKHKTGNKISAGFRKQQE